MFITGPTPTVADFALYGQFSQGGRQFKKSQEIPPLSSEPPPPLSSKGTK